MLSAMVRTRHQAAVEIVKRALVRRRRPVSRLQTHYEGTLITGEVRSSYKRASLLSSRSVAVIAVEPKHCKLMKEGAKWRL